MDPVTDHAPPAQAIRRLTIAVWVMVLLLVLNVLIAIYGQLYPPMYLRHGAGFPMPSSRSTFSSIEPLADFYEWPIEKQVQNASVIALTTFKRDGEKLQSVISEILKQQPGTTFNYEVGDEFPHGSRYIRANTSYGDGELIFFTGSPATMRYSSTYSGGRLLGLGDMPIKTLRQIVEQQRSGGSK